MVFVEHYYEKLALLRREQQVGNYEFDIHTKGDQEEALGVSEFSFE